MGALAKTYSFTAGTAIVAAQVNDNFDDVVDWATGSPTLSASGQTTTVSGDMAITGETTLLDGLKLKAAGLANQYVMWEGSNVDAFETYLIATEPTADRNITLPNATGTVALTSDITSPAWNSADNILTNSVFN